MRIRRVVPSPESTHARAPGWWRQNPGFIETILVLLALPAGLLPAWSIGDALPAQALPASQRTKVPVIIEVSRGANPEAVAQELGVVPTHVYSEVFQGFAADLPAADLSTADLPVAADRAAARQRGILRIWPDLPVRAEVQPLPTGVDRVDADENPWADINEDGGSIDADVAVLDTGIAAHPDLTIQGGTACVGSSSSDGHGHGTHVAGTIAAIDNSDGVVGVAPGARLWAVRVLDDNGVGSISSIICGLEWVYEHRDTIDVVNMSLTTKANRKDQKPCGEKTTPLHNAICTVVNDGGVSVIVAAGNQNQNAAKRAPATYDEVITVSALRDIDGKPGKLGTSTCGGRRDDRFAAFSNYGQDIDIAAPGVCIRSTWLEGRYLTTSGTSMATPHVTGAAALYVAQNPNATVDDVRAWLEGPASRPNASPYGFTGDRDAFDEGVLNLALA
jgi:subtilisin